MNLSHAATGVIPDSFMPLFAFVITYGLGYLLGSIPFGLILTRLAGLGDIRDIGSGNIGATNVLRTGNKALAVMTLILDALKGAAAVLIGLHYTPILGLIGGAAALLGHSYPVWLKYKGGKGVATAFGMTCAINLPLGLAVGFTWTTVLLLVRFSSLAALSGAALAPVYAWAFGRNDLVLFFVVIGAFIWWRHRLNIKRLINGTEPQLGANLAEKNVVTAPEPHELTVTEALQGIRDYMSKAAAQNVPCPFAVGDKVRFTPSPRALRQSQSIAAFGVAPGQELEIIKISDGLYLFFTGDVGGWPWHEYTLVEKGTHAPPRAE